MRVIDMAPVFLILMCIIDSKTSLGEILNSGKRGQRSTDTNTDTLLTIAKHGLPTTSDPKHVVIIGAGIAGLTAAKLLKDAGHNVTILEASDRVGGRILTYRDPDNKFYVELGAMRIPYKHKFVTTFVDYFNLSTSDFIGYDRDTWYYANGKKLKSWEVEENPDILGYNTSRKERGKSISQLHSEALKEVFKTCSKDGVLNDDCLTQYDQYTYQEYLTDVAGLSNGAVEMSGVIWSAEANFYTAFTEIIRFIGLGEKYEIVGGSDLLPKAFLPSLKTNIVYNARVSRVEHGNSTVVAYYPSSGRDVPILGDYLLTTATATSTSFIKFIPALDFDKQNAIRNLHYDSATKIILVFQRPFWNNESITGGQSITDLPSRSIFYPSHDFESGLGVLLASYTFSDQSMKFLGLSDEECITQALDDVAEIHGDHIRELFLEGIVKKWSIDPYSLGAWYGPTPYQLTNLRIPIVRPQGNLLFAGEHTARPHAWIDTAIRSAIEAVNCISTNQCYPDLEISSSGERPRYSVVSLIVLLANFVLCFKNA